jgi:hypothetical protein
MVSSVFPTLGVDGVGGCGGVEGYATGFGGVDVRAGVEDYGVRGLVEVASDGELICLYWWKKREEEKTVGSSERGSGSNSRFGTPERRDRATRSWGRGRRLGREGARRKGRKERRKKGKRTIVPLTQNNAASFPASFAILS